MVGGFGFRTVCVEKCDILLLSNFDKEMAKAYCEKLERIKCHPAESDSASSNFDLRAGEIGT